jgi:dienelactone hydrolase
MSIGAFQRIGVLFAFSIGVVACEVPKSENEPARQSLEEAAESGGFEGFVAAAKKNAAANTPLTTLDQIDLALRPHDRLYRPNGAGPFPVMLFFHGCSGPTLSHEEDWAAFYNGIGVVLLSVDSYSGRGLAWEEVCDFKKMTPWQRAGDVLATVGHVRTLDFVDQDAIYLTGFSHGAGSIWSTLVNGSEKSAPVSLAEWPQDGLAGVKGAFMFYGGCQEPYVVDLTSVVFLGDADRYIDARSCAGYTDDDGRASAHMIIKIYEGATHTFDHSRPNAANVAAGSVYDEAATRDAQSMIKGIILE